MAGKAWVALAAAGSLLCLWLSGMLPDGGTLPPPRPVWRPPRAFALPVQLGSRVGTDANAEMRLKDISLGTGDTRKHSEAREPDVAFAQLPSAQPSTLRRPSVTPTVSTYDKTSAANTPPHTMPPPAKKAALATPSLPDCSVVFFHHLEKTGGTTVRSILQRHAQLGEFDLISFVNRFDKLQLQMVLHRLWTLLHTPGGLNNFRLGVEIHIGGHLSHPYFFKYTLPDLLMLRQRLRAAGCRCALVTLLRHPLLQHLSWHFHFVNHRVPLCYWSNPPDCQSRLGMGLTCHDGPHIPPLTASHAAALRFMWNCFDLVGVTELFDEFVLLLAELVGLPRPEYRMQIVAKHTVAQQAAQREWTSKTCATLLRGETPTGLKALITARMASSKENARRHQERKGGSSTGGKPGMMECRGYGPCEVPHLSGRERIQDAEYHEPSCSAVTEAAVLERMCSRLGLDEQIYFEARSRFEKMLQRYPAHDLEARLRELQRKGQLLESRAVAQAAESRAALERRAGTELQRKYRQSSGLGVPWVVDETSPWYQPHERARYSCHNCSGDVVPEKDLVGCWPLWPQFAPDELQFRCTREWTDDPGFDRAQHFRSGKLPMPCWRTCWTPLSDGGPAPHAGKHCAPACPTGKKTAREWRDEWDAALDEFWRSKEGRELKEVSVFEASKRMDDFIWNVY